MKKSKSSSDQTSAEIISYNENILTQIFLSLPVKSLITFKLINWYPNNDFLLSPTLTLPMVLQQLLFKTTPLFFSLVDSSSIILLLIKSIMFLYPAGKLFCLPFYFLGTASRFHNRAMVFYSGFSVVESILFVTPQEFQDLPSTKVDGEFTWISSFTLTFDPSQSPYYKFVYFKMFMK